MTGQINYTANPYTVETAVLWLEVYQQALETLPPDLFTAWLIGVGMFGNDNERASKGMVLLPMLQAEYRRRMAAAEQHAKTVETRRKK